MDGHPIHLHGYRFKVTATDGGTIPSSAQWPETTVWVPVGSTRDVQFVADVPGDWALHCHITHHVMNQMGHGIPNMLGVRTSGAEKKVGDLVPGTMLMGQSGMGDMMEMRQPDNSISMLGGDGPFGLIDMGGMFTVLKVRDRLDGDRDPGWFQHPAGTVADEATESDLSRDGIKT